MLIFIRIVFLLPLLVCAVILGIELVRRVRGMKRPAPVWRSVVHFSFFFAAIYAVFVFFLMQQINEYVSRAP